MQSLLSQLHLAAASLEFEKESLRAEVLSLRAEVAYLRVQLDARDPAAGFPGLAHIPYDLRKHSPHTFTDDVNSAGRQELGRRKPPRYDTSPNSAADGRVSSAGKENNHVSAAIPTHSQQHGLTETSKAVASASSKRFSATVAHGKPSDERLLSASSSVADKSTGPTDAYTAGFGAESKLSCSSRREHDVAASSSCPVTTSLVEDPFFKRTLFSSQSSPRTVGFPSTAGPASGSASPFATVSGPLVGATGSFLASGLGSSPAAALNSSSSALVGPPVFNSPFASAFGTAETSKNTVPATGAHLVSAFPASSASVFSPPNPFGGSASRSGFTSSAASPFGHQSGSAFGPLGLSTFRGCFADSSSRVAPEVGSFSSSGLFRPQDASNVDVFGAQAGSALTAGTKGIFEPTLSPDCDATSASVNALFRVPIHGISAKVPTTLNTTHFLVVADEHSDVPGRFVAITMMHQFKDFSLEELRLADYTDGIEA